MELPPLSLRITFPQEASKPLPLLSLRTVWPPENRTTCPVAGESQSTVLRRLDKVQIRKPPGSVTRLSRKGYSLETALGWQDHELYVDVQRFVQKQVNTHLQRHQPMSKQDPKELDVVCTNVSSEYDIMRRYEHHWATKDFIRIYLSNARRRR